jgi:hypothetical protein
VGRALAVVAGRPITGTIFDSSTSAAQARLILDSSLNGWSRLRGDLALSGSPVTWTKVLLDTFVQ